jgi:hypothetical protein
MPTTVNGRGVLMGAATAASVCLALTSAACGASTRPDPATAASAGSDSDGTSELLDHHRFHHHGGFTLLVVMGLDTLGVPPDRQPAVDQARLALQALLEPPRVAERHLVEALADGLSSAALDPSRDDVALVGVRAAAARVYPSSAPILDALHAALTPLERRTLVAKVDASWSVWQLANDDGPGVAGGGIVAALADDTTITPEEMKKVAAGVGGGSKVVPPLDREGASQSLRAFDEAFVRDTFDAASLSTVADTNARVIDWGSSHLASIVESASLVLTSAQRATLAARLRSHAEHSSAVEAWL